MEMGEVFFTRCKFGVLQYVLLKPLCTLAEIVTHSIGVYGGSERFTWGEAYIYISIVTNTSQMVALYALISFYQHTHEELSQWNPLPKFASIKMVVFFTYWQGLVLSSLQQYGVIRGTEYFTSGQVNNGLQNLCICVEMVVFAFAHHLAFDVKQFWEGAAEDIPKTQFWEGLAYTFYLETIKRDVVHFTRRSEYQKLNLASMFSGPRNCYGSDARVGEILAPEDDGDNGFVDDTQQHFTPYNQYTPTESRMPRQASLPDPNLQSCIASHSGKPDAVWSKPDAVWSPDSCGDASNYNLDSERIPTSLDAFNALRESCL